MWIDYGKQIVTLIIMLTLSVTSSGARAQGPGPQQVGGLKSVLPPVPRQHPRPAEGMRRDEQWQIERPEDDKQPVASFIDSLKGADAALRVVVGQGRLLTTKRPIAKNEGVAVIAVGDPSIVDFEVLPDPRMIRLIGSRAGVTDLSITTTDGEVFGFEVHVGYDLDLLRAQLKQVFPDALLRLGQIREHLVVEGQARSAAQVAQILGTIQAYLVSLQSSQFSQGGASATVSTAPPPRPFAQQGNGSRGQAITVGEEGGRGGVAGAVATPQIINLIRVPGVQQVMLQVKIAELNRSGLREIGADIFVNAAPDAVIGTQIGGAVADLLGLGLGNPTTAFGIFSGGDTQIFLRALRRNRLLTILAEPNLVTMSGHPANFLAGGQFPVPIPQGGGGANNAITVQYKDFGVQLNFVPFVLDEEVIRLTVSPEVSSIDEALGTTLVVGGDPVPGLNTRRASTTVELRQGETLAIAGLLQVEVDGSTDRIPGLGDLPYVGPLFSNTTHRRDEKELLVLVTPYLVGPMQHDEVPPLPGTEIQDPDDHEFYLLNRIEGRGPVPFPGTTSWDAQQRRQYRLELKSLCGPIGFSESE